MIAGLIVPSGNLAALTPQQVTVKPIAGVAVAVGDLVRFDLGSASSYSTLANIANYDEPTCGFNVVLTPATTEEGGVFGIVTQAAAAGQVCTVCVAGVVDAKFTGACTRGVTVLINGTTALVPSATAGTGVGLAIPLATQASGTAIISVLFYGWQMGSQSA